jgi:transcriptional regulator with XRE-family HTH domain
MSTFGERVRRERRARDLTQAGLGQLVGAVQQTIYQIEKGVAGETRFVVRIAQALDVNAEWLRTGQGPKTPADWAAYLDMTELSEDTREVLRVLASAIRDGRLSERRLRVLMRMILDD